MNPSRSLLTASAFALLLGSSGASAHTINLDGSASEWFGALPPVTDLARISRNSTGAGEFLWSDAAGDQRAAWPTRPHDLREVRVTGDSRFLYVMAKLDGPVATAGDSVPQLQVTIDTDRFAYSGGLAFVDSAGFEIAGTGAYELLVETRFGSGSAPRLVNGRGAELEPVATSALSAAGVIEIAVPWSALGLQFVPTSSLRLGAALFLTRADDVPLDAGDGLAGRAADVMTQYGAPGTTGTTATELANGALDYTAELWFNGHGDVVPPISINEVYFGTGVNSQWIEVVNATQAVVSLSNFKVGDEETAGGNEAIAQFPAGTLLVPGETFVVARDGAAFFAEHGQRADGECDAGDPSTPDMGMFPAWAMQNGFNLPTGGDEVLVLDAANTVVDVMTYRNGSWPGVVPHPGATGTNSLERTNPSHDTDDCAVDFAVQSVPSPGFAVQVAAVGDSRTSGPLAWAPPAPNPSRGRVTLSLRLAAAGETGVDVLDAAGRLVRQLHRGPAGTGELRLVWDGRDDGGQAAPAGVYFVRAAAPGGTANLRVTVIR